MLIENASGKVMEAPLIRIWFKDRDLFGEVLMPWAVLSMVDRGHRPVYGGPLALHRLRNQRDVDDVDVLDISLGARRLWIYFRCNAWGWPRVRIVEAPSRRQDGSR